MKSKRQLQKESTRNKIIETAYIVYSNQGFSATTATIAKEAGVSHGTIFVHFPSVDDLLCSVIQDFGDSLVFSLHKLAEKNSTTQELLTTYLSILSEYENFYIRLVTERNLLPQDAKITLEKLQSSIAYHFHKVIEEERKNEEIKKIPDHMIFNTWMGLLNYYLQNKEYFSPESPLINRYGAKIITTFIELIKK